MLKDRPVYVGMALLARRGPPILPAALALPLPLMTPIAGMTYAAWVRWPFLRAWVPMLLVPGSGTV